MKRWIFKKTRRFRMRFASWLIEADVERAIFVGPKACRLTWESKYIYGATIAGAEIAFLFNGGSVSTVFEDSK